MTAPQAPIRALISALALMMMAACSPSDGRPGLWLSGNESGGWPEDWSFTNEHREVFLQVSTPYLIPHSVTIWCAEVDGNLYVAAARAAEKRWPAWVDDDPEVTLKVADELYPARLAPLNVTRDADELSALGRAYQEKYRLEGDGRPNPATRYWRVLPREG